MALPLLFLLFMVPIPYIIYDLVAFPLKLFVTKVSVGFLKGPVSRCCGREYIQFQRRPSR